MCVGLCTVPVAVPSTSPCVSPGTCRSPRFTYPAVEGVALLPVAPLCCLHCLPGGFESLQLASEHVLPAKGREQRVSSSVPHTLLPSTVCTVPLPLYCTVHTLRVCVRAKLRDWCRAGDCCMFATSPRPEGTTWPRSSRMYCTCTSVSVCRSYVRSTPAFAHLSPFPRINSIVNRQSIVCLPC